MLKRIFFKSQYSIGFLFFIIFWMSGCTANRENTMSVSTPISTALSINEVNLPLITAIPATLTINAPTKTPLPTETSTPITQLSTTTPVPTLTIDKEGELLSLLMQNNGSCDLPCWWGVTPGTTDVQVVHDMFISKALNGWERTSDYEEVGLGYASPDYPYYSRDTRVKFWIEDELINFIEVDARPLSEEVRPVFDEDWATFSLDNVLDRYGVPSIVGFIEPEQAPYYVLTLSYDELGIEISYVIPYELLNNGNKKICFDSETHSIFLALYVPGQSDQAPITLISDSDHRDSYVSWEMTTGSDLIAFQQLFEDETNPPCVEVQAE